MGVQSQGSSGFSTMELIVVLLVLSAVAYIMTRPNKRGKRKGRARKGGKPPRMLSIVGTVSLIGGVCLAIFTAPTPAGGFGIGFGILLAVCGAGCLWNFFYGV